MHYEKALCLITIEYVGGFAEAESEYRAKIGGDVVGIGETPEEAVRDIQRRQTAMEQDRAKVRRLCGELSEAARYF